MTDIELVVHLQVHVELMDNLIKNHNGEFKQNCKRVYNRMIKEVNLLSKISLKDSDLDGLDNTVNRIADVLNAEYEKIKKEIET